MKTKILLLPTTFILVLFSCTMFGQQIKYDEKYIGQAKEKNSIDTVLRFAPGDKVSMTFNSPGSFALDISTYGGKTLLEYKKQDWMITSLSFTVDTFCFYSLKFTSCPDNFNFKIDRKESDKQYKNYSIKPKWKNEPYKEVSKIIQNVPLIKDKVNLPAMNKNNPNKYSPVRLEVNLPENASKWIYKLIVTDNFEQLSELYDGQYLSKDVDPPAIEDSIDFQIFTKQFIDSISKKISADSVIQYHKYKDHRILPGSIDLIETPKHEVSAKTGSKYYIVLINRNHNKDVFARIAVYAYVFETKTKRIPIYN